MKHQRAFATKEQDQDHLVGRKQIGICSFLSTAKDCHINVRNKMSKKNKVRIKIKIDKKVKTRNELARIAHFKSGAGAHKDKKKEKNKKMCRKKIRF